MNKIISANINGYVFQIDEKAYETLKIYLDALRLKVNDSETFTDIENRIAEIFNHHLQQGNQAIFMGEVEKVIAQIGSIDDFEDNQQDSGESINQPKTTQKRLFRDPSDKLISGVCSGLAAYIGIDVRIIRIIFILLATMSIGVFLYFIFIVIVPEATTSADRLQMHGKPIDFNNLGDIIKENTRDTVNKMKEETKKIKYHKAIKIIAAIALFGILSVVIPAIFAALFSFGVISMFIESLQSYFFIGIHNILFPLIATSIIVIVPFFMVTYTLLRILIDGKKMPKPIKYILNTTWVLAIIYMFYLSAVVGKDFSKSSTVTENKYPNSEIKDSTIHIQTNKFKLSNTTNEVEIEVNDIQFFIDQRISQDVELQIFKSLQNKPYLKIEKSSRGSNANSLLYSNGIEYEYNFDGSTLKLDNYFKLNDQTPWRNQKVKLTLFVPVGYTVIIDKNCQSIIEEVDNQELCLDNERVESATLKSTDQGMLFIR